VVEHYPQHPEVAGLRSGAACSEREKIVEKVKKALYDCVRGICRVVEHSPHHPEVAGLSPSATDFTRSEKW
jgi:hypothetical protein